MNFQEAYKKYQDRFLLASILIAGCFLRLYYFLLNSSHPLQWDEAFHASAGVLLAKTVLNNFSSEYFITFWNQYPGSLASLFFYPFGYDVLSTISFLLFGFNDLAARFPALIFSCLLIFATYLLGKELFNIKIGLLGAMFIAFNPLFIVLGNMALVDVPLVTAIIFSLYFCHKALRENKISSWVYAGLLAALAGFMKPPGFIIAPFLFILIFYYKGFKFLFNPKVLLMGLVASSFVILYFGLGVAFKTIFVNNNFVTLETGEQVSKEIFSWFNQALNYKEVEDPDTFSIEGLLYYPNFLAHQLGGYVFFILAFFGALVLYLKKERTKSLGIVLLFIFYIFFIFTLLVGNKDIRFTISYVPTFLLLSAVAFYLVFERLKANWTTISYLILFLVLFTYSFVGVNNVLEINHWTREQKDLTNVVDFITEQEPGLVVIQNEDTYFNIQNLSYYISLNDPDLSFSVRNMSSSYRAKYLVVAEEVSDGKWKLVYEYDGRFVYKSQ